MSDQLALAALPIMVADKIKSALPNLTTCRAIAGRLDLDEVKRAQYPTPAVLVSRVRLDQVKGLSGPYPVYRAMLAAFVLTKDALGLTRDDAAAAIVQTILCLLPDARFGSPDIGPVERITEEPIVTKQIREAGIALSAITWEQDISLTPLPEGSTVVPSVYVGADQIGGAA